MVYLDVYNTIFEYLEDIGVVDDVFEYSKEVMGPLFDRIKGNEVLNDMVAEFALFNYWQDGKILIDFLYEKLYPNLNKNEKKEFDLIRESERVNLNFNKKEKQGRLDTKGKELYDFYFHDEDKNETKIVVSSTALEEINKSLNARLIKHPEHEGKYLIVGRIFDKKTSEAVSSLSSIKFVQERYKEIASYTEGILAFSKERTLAEIKHYKNEKSNFLEQDKKIMKINKVFFKKFDMGFDDFLGNFLKLSNDAGKFIDMAEYYVSIADELNEAVLDTNYSFSLNLLFETSLVKGFGAFVKKDREILGQSLSELIERGKKEFENSLNNNIALSRENVIKNSKKFLNDKLKPMKLKGYGAFIKKLDSYSPENVKEFLSDIVEYLDKLPEDTDEMDISFFLAMTMDLLEQADDLPYLDETLAKQNSIKYIPEKFYEYIDVDDEVYNMHLFLAVASHISCNEAKKAYNLAKEDKPMKTESFSMMFLLGKILSFFNDIEYKRYFHEAKKIDKARYRAELEIFLNDKTQGVLSL